jgi:hypothetical protein
MMLAGYELNLCLTFLKEVGVYWTGWWRRDEWIKGRNEGGKIVKQRFEGLG